MKLSMLPRSMACTLLTLMALQWSTTNALLVATGHKKLTAPMSNITGKDHGQVLYLVYSDSRFYNTRMEWVLETWGKYVPRSAFTVIGDSPFNSSRAKVIATTCPPHSHEEGACCKYAEAVIYAHQVMQQDKRFEWAYFVDDDTYVRPAALEQALASVPPNPAGKGQVLGNLGCRSEPCSGICAGGGYAASRRAVELAVGADANAFLQEQMGNCRKCGRWADMAMSEIFHSRQIPITTIPGLYGWKLNKWDFDKTLALANQPLMYHYVQSESQMMVLDGLFGHNQSNSTYYSNYVESDFDEPDRTMCSTYRNRTICSTSSDPVNTPWLALFQFSNVLARLRKLAQ